VATRTDARGNVLAYSFDELDRLSAVDILVDAAGDPYARNGVMDLGDLLNPGEFKAVTGVAYAYDPATQNLNTITSTGEYLGGGSAGVIFQVDYDYDPAGRLIADRQSHDGPVTADTPATIYGWGAFPQQDRLAAITYPVAPLNPYADPPEAPDEPRAVALSYGQQAGDVDDVLDRVTRIAYSDPAVPVPDVFAEYAYGGMGRRASVTYGNGISQSFLSGGGYTGLDTFGRVNDLHFKVGPNTVHRYQYGYDKAGNRLWALITQAPQPDGQGGWIAHDNDRSYLYRYDNLHRLVEAERGELEFDGPNGVIKQNPLPCAMTWRLDNLGNFSGGDPTAGSVVWAGDCDGDGAPEFPPTAIHHVTDQANRITETWADGALRCADPDLTYDADGNLTGDCQFTYQYDAFNRLIRVLQGPQPFPLEIARFGYDGLGRLIYRAWVVPGTGGGDDIFYQRHFYYDGVRRITQDLAELVIDYPPPDYLPVGRYEHEPERDYVYGPDYVDEFIAQIDPQLAAAQDPAAVSYVLQDAQFNVVGLANEAGDVVRQYTYSPYGTIVATESLAAHPSNSAGFQGLFYLNLTDPLASDPLAADPFASDVQGFYWMRNRLYDPVTARPIQRDPNETAIPLLSAAMHARGLDAFPGTFDLEYLYGDGLSLYQFVGGNPINLVDPLGLDWTATDTAAAAGASAGLAAIGAAVLGGILGQVANLTGNVVAYQTLTQTLVDDIDYGLAQGGAIFARAYGQARDSVLSAGGLWAGLSVARELVSTGLAFAAMSQADAVDKSNELVERIWQHANNKVSTGGPGDWNFNHWRGEIRAWAEKIRDVYTKRMRGKTAKKWLKYAEDVLDWLERPFKGPPPSAPAGS